MLKKTFLKRMTKSTLISFALLVSNLSAFAVVDMTPYPTYQPPGTYFQGVTYILPDGMDIKERLRHDLVEMRNNYNINCLSLYALGSLNPDDCDLLFHLLDSLGMQAVVRIEAYDPAWMNFEPEDAERMVSNHLAMIEYVSSEQRRDQVAYFALNVPTDDDRVARNFRVEGQYENGRDNPLWASSQVPFVERFVARMKEVCNSLGFTNAKQYVSVFYNWNYDFDIPSYASSNAEGYFINSYSYPLNPASPPDENASDAELINQEKLERGMNKFMGQYPLASQEKIIEYGFQTVEFQGGTRPDQGAGLVKTYAAKARALRVTNSFYDPARFPGLRGTQYFAWNEIKEEGTPADSLDWCLNYPKKNIVEAENSSLYGNAEQYIDPSASNGKGVNKIDFPGDAVAVHYATKTDLIRIRYACEENSQLSLYINGQFRQKVIFASTGAWTGSYGIVDIPTTVPMYAAIRLQFDAGDRSANIDYFDIGGSASFKAGSTLTNNPEFMILSVPEIGICPNPFDDVLKVTLSEASDFKTVYVMDESGKLLEVINIQGSGQLNIGSSYKPGTYFLRFISGKGDKSVIAIKK